MAGGLVALVPRVEPLQPAGPDSTSASGRGPAAEPARLDGVLRFRLVACALLTSSAACARTGLPSSRAGETDGTGGAGLGGGPSTGGGGAGTGGAGTGGVSVGGYGGSSGTSCTVEEPIAKLPSDGFMAAFAPQLTYASIDRTWVTLTSAWQATEGPGEIPPPELRHTSFEPWTAWPLDGDLGPTYLADFDAGGSYAAAPDGNGFALLFQSPLAPPAGSGLFYMPSLVPDSGAVPAAYPIDGTFTHAIALAEEEAPGGQTHLAVYAAQGFEGELLQSALIDDSGPSPVVTSTAALGCTSTTASAAVVTVGTTYFVAHASSTAPDCQTGPAVLESVLLDRIGLDGTVSTTAIQEAGADVLRVLAAPRSDGAWIAWTRYADVGAELYVARVDLEGHPVGAIASTPVADGVEVAVAEVGDYLAVATTHPEENAGERIEVAVYADGLVTLAVGGVLPFAQVQGPLALVSAPDAADLVVAWSQGNGPEQEVHAAKLSCVLAIPL